MSKPRRQFFLWVVALAVVLFILLHESLIGGKGLVPADGVLVYPPWNQETASSNYLLIDQYCTFIPQHEFVHQQMLRGHFPLWNPYLDCGIPNLDSIQGALLFPINLLLLPLDPFYAGGLAAFLKLFLAGWFTMLYLRLLGASHAAAFLSGLVFSLSGFMIVWLGHPHVNCAMWLPLLLYFVEKSFRSGIGRHTSLLAGPVLRAWLGLVVAFGFMLLGGHPPTAIQITIVVLFYFFFRLLAHRRDQPFQRVGLLAGSLVTGFLLAAPQLLPYFEYYRQSSSGLSSAALQRWAERLTPNTLIYFLFPHLSGSPVEGFEDMPKLLGLGALPNFNERTGYFGVLPLLFALFAVVGRRCKFTIFHLCVVFGSLLVIYGVPPLPALLRLLPGLCDINQTRLLLFVAFSMAVLAGLGWDTFSRMKERRRARWIVLGFWAAVGVALLWLWRIIGSGFRELDPSHRAFLMGQFFILAGSLVASGVMVLWRARWRRWGLITVCLGWTAADLLWFGMGYNPSIPHDRYYPGTPAIEWLKKDASSFRIIGGGAVLIPNTAAVYGLSDARGCDFMSVRRYEELITGNAGNFWFYIYPTAASTSESFQLLNVKYVLLPKPLAINPDGYDLVYSNEIAIYRYEACEERALAVFNYQVGDNPASILAKVRSTAFDPKRVLLLEEEPKIVAGKETIISVMETNVSVRITTYEPDEVRVEASLPQPGFLLLLDTYFPGWTASVNGQPTRIYRADYNFRAVSLPAGKSTIRFSYQPKSLCIGLALSATSLLTLGGVWFWSRKWPPVGRK
ncbi:MAG: YfhO family protein [Verrucomicrobiota bacterium]|jgi:hypothetical protein